MSSASPTTRALPYLFDFSDGSCCCLDSAQSFLFPDRRYTEAVKYLVSDGRDRAELVSLIGEGGEHEADLLLLSFLQQQTAHVPDDNRHVFERARRSRPFAPSAAMVKLAVGNVSVVIAFPDLAARQHFIELRAMSTGVDVKADEFAGADIQVMPVAGHWQIDSADGETLQVPDQDEAMVCALFWAHDLIAKRLDPLFIAHAGAVRLGGRAVLLPGLGGRGKSTLVAALDARHGGLINDDNVPVDWNGTLTQLGGPIKLRQPAWAAVEAFRPELKDCPAVRFGDDTVKLLPGKDAATMTISSGIEPLMVVCPAFEAGVSSHCERISSAAVLKQFIDSNSMFPMPFSIERLDAMHRFFDRVPGWSIRYGCTDAALELIHNLINSECK